MTADHTHPAEGPSLGLFRGGVAALRACKALDAAAKKAKGDEKTGVDIVRRALTSPIKQIAANAGLEGAIVCQRVTENSDPNYGYNAMTGEYGDLIKMGVLVPTKVERVALQNAASVASLLLTTDCIISEIPEKKDKAGPPGGGMPPGGMGGMPPPMRAWKGPSSASG